jgi:hypothetical protein
VPTLQCIALALRIQPIWPVIYDTDEHLIAGRLREGAKRRRRRAEAGELAMTTPSVTVLGLA